MEESDRIHDLLAAREILKSSIEESRSVAIAVDDIGSRLNEASRNVDWLQAAIRNVACKCAVYGIRGHVGRAIGPAAGVMKVLDVVDELQDALDGNPHDVGLFVYLANVRRLEDALKLLADNCGLLITWLEDVAQFLRDNVADDGDGCWYFDRLSKVLEILVELQGKGEEFRQDGGVLSSAFDSLEGEFRHLLMECDSGHRADSCFCSNEEDGSIDESSFMEPVIRELQAITEVLAANNRLDRCLSLYTEVRIGNARAALQSLDLDYLDIELSEAVSVQTVEGYVYQWDKHMTFVVTQLLQKEYRLCCEAFHRVGSDVWMHCFAKVASECGFNDIFEFGNAVCRCKKEAIKLLMLLKIFSTLDRLRLDFNDLFGGKSCVMIRNQTRDLVKKVVDGAYEIFWELLVQVEMQRESSPPLDGNVPRLVRFVTEYCNQLLEDENSSILAGILEIYQVWNQVKFEDGLLSIEIHNIMKALEINLETWAKGYNDITLSYLFMMNNHWYLCNSNRGTKLGDLMGSSWLWAYEESTEYYAALYMRESWEKLLVFLREEDLILFPGGRAIDRDLVKKRVSAFSEAFDDMYKKQSKWILSDKALRWKTCQLVVKTIIPPYTIYLQRFMPGLEHETDVGNHVRYTPDNLENLISSLFQQKLGKYSSSKCTEVIGIKNAAMNHFSSTPAAA